MKILLTGWDGYIGSHLKPALESAGHQVIPYIGDIRDWDHDRLVKPDMIIHLAALTGVRKSIDSPEEYYSVNVLGTREVFMYASENDIKLIFMSSSNAKEVTNPYAETKFINEMERPPNSIGIRPHTVYPGRKDMLYESIRDGRVSYINGIHARDFTHIEDFISALFTIMENYDKLVGKVIDVGTGRAVGVAAVARAMGWVGELSYDPTPHERVVTRADITELNELGWAPKKDIFNEIRHTQ